MSVRFTIVLPLMVTACSGQVTPTEPATDEAPLYGLRSGDAGKPDPLRLHHDRVRLHGGKVLPAMRVQIVYVGNGNEGGAPSRDEVVRFTLTSGSQYWGLLEQYGVGAGSLAGSVRISKAALIPSSLDTGAPEVILPIADLEARIRTLLNPAKGTSIVPKAEGYLFFLPNGINVALGSRGSKVFTSCIDVGAYHRFDGIEPYSVFPPCELGRSARAISHELAEMATDPVVGKGWFSDGDQEMGIGEIADLCNVTVHPPIGGHALTQLWSNADGRCMPAPSTR